MPIAALPASNEAAILNNEITIWLLVCRNSKMTTLNKEKLDPGFPLLFNEHFCLPLNVHDLFEAEKKLTVNCMLAAGGTAD
jgi:hypothetical protein